MAKYLNGATGKPAAEILPAMEQLASVFRHAVDSPVTDSRSLSARNQTINETISSLVHHARAIIGPDAKGTDVIAASSILKQCHHATTRSFAASASGDRALPRRVQLLKLTADKIVSPRGFRT